MNPLVPTAAALCAFAANSLLCRAALRDGGIDPAAFTLLRLLSGALVLVLIVRWRRGAVAGAGSWRSASALLGYAAAFSFAYATLTAATGALLLFGAVQATMIATAIARGERPSRLAVVGIAVAAAGLVGLLLPGLEAPDPAGAMLMLAAGVAWGVYSLRGRDGGDPVRATAGNFARAALLSLPLLAFAGRPPAAEGVALAIVSGALASGVGYALWYAVLPSLRRVTAATVQLAVPLLTALAGIVLLGEPATARVAVAGAAILGGIALVVRAPARRLATPPPLDSTVSGKTP
jgi:drug/metabolite transporter (DMT)-like permease